MVSFHDYVAMLYKSDLLETRMVSPSLERRGEVCGGLLKTDKSTACANSVYQAPQAWCSFVTKINCDPAV